MIMYLSQIGISKHKDVGAKVNLIKSWLQCWNEYSSRVYLAGGSVCSVLLHSFPFPKQFGGCVRLYHSFPQCL